MAISLFSVTAAVLASDLLPTYTLGAATNPTDTRALEIIRRRAAMVSGAVDALGLDASALDATGEPIAFYFCQRLVLVGAAADVALAFTGHVPSDGLVSGWRSEWEDGMRTLRDPQRAKAALHDAVGATFANQIRTHVQAAGSVASEDTDVALDAPEFSAGMDL